MSMKDLINKSKESKQDEPKETENPSSILKQNKPKVETKLGIKGISDNKKSFTGGKPVSNISKTESTKKLFQVNKNQPPVKDKEVTPKIGFNIKGTKTPAEEKPKPAFSIGKGNKSTSNPETENDFSDIKIDESNSVSNILGDLSIDDAFSSVENDAKTDAAPQSIQQNINKPPTIDDLSKFVFEEQPDESTEEIATKFSQMLDNLSAAVGSDIPTILSDTLSFLKQHPFLAGILKPENVGDLVRVMGKSYGFVANAQTQKSTKKAAKSARQNDILNSLEGIQF